MEDIIAQKFASDIVSLENVISCYIIKNGEIIGKEEKKDFKEKAIVLAGLVGEICEGYEIARIKFKDYKTVIVRYEDTDIAVFFEKDIDESTVITDIMDIVSGVSL